MMRGPLTVAAVRARVEDIRASAGDDEAAHGMEDQLFESVLRAVADGHPQSVAMAKAALRSLELDFERWCA